jgi:hypothetical protein
MSKNPNERQRMPGKTEDLDRGVQEQKSEKQPKDRQEMNKEQQHHRQSEPMGHKTHKPTVQFDKGQKFTSDEDIIRKSA